MGYNERPFDPMNQPEQCPCCNDHPSWEEVAQDVFQCENCLAVIDSEGKILKEPAQDDDSEELE